MGACIGDVVVVVVLGFGAVVVEEDPPNACDEVVTEALLVAAQPARPKAPTQASATATRAGRFRIRT
jgi:hypothetical protein